MALFFVLPWFQQKRKGVKTLYQMVVLDMDGTLRDEAHGIPESAKEAVYRCQKKGCLVCLCTGRTLGTITDDVISLGLDGIIAGGGSYIEFRRQKIKDASFQPETVERVFTFLKASQQTAPPFTLETQEKIFMNQKAVNILTAQNDRKWQTLDEEQRNRIQADLKIAYENNMADFHSGSHLVNKLCLWADSMIYRQTEQILQKPNIHLAQQWSCPEYQYYEIIQKGCDKGTALRTLRRFLNIPKQAVIAFGDGKNDIDMLLEAGTAVVMENACRDLHPYADSVCEDTMGNGIFLELQRRNIIG